MRVFIEQKVKASFSVLKNTMYCLKNEKDVFKGTKSELKDFHQKTYELRNQYLAHAGVSDHETIALVAILNPDLRNKKLEAIKGTIFRLMDDDSNINKYLDLYAHVAQHAFNKVKDLNPIIMRKAKELSIDTMYSELKVPQRESLIPMDIITDLK